MCSGCGRYVKAGLLYRRKLPVQQEQVLSREDFEEAAINPPLDGVGATVLNSDDKYSGAKSLKSPARAAQAIRTGVEFRPD